MDNVSLHQVHRFLQLAQNTQHDTTNLNLPAWGEKKSIFKSIRNIHAELNLFQSILRVFCFKIYFHIKNKNIRKKNRRLNLSGVSWVNKD